MIQKQLPLQALREPAVTAGIMSLLFLLTLSGRALLSRRCGALTCQAAL
jgi:hypothetical protein